MLHITVERIDLLIKLKEKTRLFLLSNSNRIHYDKYVPQINSAFSIDFIKLFEKAYFSFNLKLLKPSPEIYQYVIDKHSLNPARTLFIDDSIANIEGAQAVGLQTYWLKEGEDICDLFDLESE